MNEKLEQKLIDTFPQGTKSIVIMTYGEVLGYQQGVYGDGKVMIYAPHTSLRCGGQSHNKAQEVVRDQLNRFWQDFDPTNNKDRIEKVYLFSGLYGERTPLDAALSVMHDLKKRDSVVLVSCSCCMIEEKKHLQENKIILEFPEHWDKKNRMRIEEYLKEVVDNALGEKK